LFVDIIFHARIFYSVNRHFYIISQLSLLQKKRARFSIPSSSPSFSSPPPRPSTESYNPLSMSGSPPQEPADDAHGTGTAVDAASNTAAATESPPKRGRGRPKGSKNKKSGTSAAEASGEEAPKRKRGRPPKRKAEDEAVDPPPKRKRGRPPKNPKPETDEDADHVEPAAESSTAAVTTTKRKRVGRPRKVAND